MFSVQRERSVAWNGSNHCNQFIFAKITDQEMFGKEVQAVFKFE